MRLFTVLLRLRTLEHRVCLNRLRERRLGRSPKLVVRRARHSFSSALALANFKFLPRTLSIVSYGVIVGYLATVLFGRMESRLSPWWRTGERNYAGTVNRTCAPILSPFFQRKFKERNVVSWLLWWRAIKIWERIEGEAGNRGAFNFNLWPNKTCQRERDTKVWLWDSKKMTRISDQSSIRFLYVLSRQLVRVDNYIF